jgi:hypothetical protein
MKIALWTLTTLLTAALGVTLVGWWWSTHRLARLVFRHVDELLGARRYESDRGATQRRRWGWLLSDGTARTLWPIQTAGGSQAMPMPWRLRRYVQLTVTHRRFPHPTGRRDVHAVTLWWTSEADPYQTTWFERLEKKVAQALGRHWTGGLFDRHVDWWTSRVTLSLSGGSPTVPDRLGATEELTGERGAPRDW